MTSRSNRTSWAVGLLAGTIIPFIGYATLIGAHVASGEAIPRLAFACLPAAVFAPDYPSWTTFILVSLSSGERAT